MRRHTHAFAHVDFRDDAERAECPGVQSHEIEAGDILHHLAAHAHHVAGSGHDGESEHEIANGEVFVRQRGR